MEINNNELLAGVIKKVSLHDYAFRLNDIKNTKLYLYNIKSYFIVEVSKDRYYVKLDFIDNDFIILVYYNVDTLIDDLTIIHKNNDGLSNSISSSVQDPRLINFINGVEL